MRWLHSQGDFRHPPVRPAIGFRFVASLVLCLGMSQASALDYVLGADLSFLKQQEDAGMKFKDSGIVKPGLRIFRDHGYNWLRLRVFHTVKNSPVSLPNDLPYTLAMAKQGKALGFKLLLDLHYSDTWADPGKQTLPKAWEGLSHDVLVDSVYRYTRDVMRSMALQGVTPDMVQIGNEINNGILWPDGGIANWNHFSDLLKAGIRGIDSSGAPRPLILLHIACGGDTATTTWFFDKVFGQDIPVDVLGQSYYPLWQGTPQDLGRNLNRMSLRYGKDILVVETAFAEYPNGQGSPFPLTDAGQTDYLRSLDSIVRAVPAGRGKGLLWWEPTGNEYLGGPRGLFDRQGNAKPALRLFDGRVSALVAKKTMPMRFLAGSGVGKAGFSSTKVLLLLMNGRQIRDSRQSRPIRDGNRRSSPGSCD